MKIFIEILKLTTLPVLLLFFSMPLFAQYGIGIGTNSPDPSAILDIQSSNKGFLVPRLDDENKITNPANGLLFYNTTLNALQYNKGPDGVEDWEIFDLTTSTIRQSSARKYSSSVPRLRPTPNNDNINYDYTRKNAGTIAHYHNIQDVIVFTNNTDAEDLLYDNGLAVEFKVKETGRYRITMNLSTYIATRRLGNDRTGLRNIGVNLQVNNNARGTCSLDFAIRSEAPYEDIVRKERTTHRLTEILELAANDIIRVRIFNTHDTTSGEDHPMFLVQEDDVNSFFIEKLR